MRKHAVATSNHLRICLRREENQENLCRDDRLQDPPDAYGILASSPANERIWGIP
jgi:hypothetical protein